MAQGFFWGTNNPYLRPVWFRLFREPLGLDPTKANVGSDVNPAHVIYELMTNTDWGLAHSADALDVASYEAAAVTLYDEDFGISFGWEGQTEADVLIGEILDLIHAVHYVHPRTGLFTLDLLREDYDVGTLPVLTPDNARLSNFQRKMWGEMGNSVTVTYTDRETGEDKTLTVHDLAHASMQGKTIDVGKNYYMLREGSLAARCGERDLRASVAPIVVCDVELLREHWDVVPGQPFKLTWPEYEVVDLVIRLGAVDYGKPGDSYVRASVGQDVFGLPAASYLSVPDSAWVNPAQEPEPMSFLEILTAPVYFQLNNNLGVDLSGLEDPEAVNMLLAGQDNLDTYGYVLFSEIPDPAGTLRWVEIAQRSVVGVAELASAIVAEAQTAIASFTNVQNRTYTSGWLILGDGDETTMEFCWISGFDGSGWVIERGLLDTVPRAWAAGTRCWFLPNDISAIDQTVRAETEVAKYRLLSQTSLGTLDYDDAAEQTFTVTGRPHMPIRPANVKIENNVGAMVGFGTVDVSGLADFDITWSRRNREAEVTQFLGWTAGDVTPEVGQTHDIFFTHVGTGILTHTVSGVFSDSYNMFRAPNLAVGELYYVDVKSKFGASDYCLQWHRLTIQT